jgi:hypothetical protein
MQNVDKGHSGTNRRKRKRTPTKPVSGPVESITVHPLLWADESPINLRLVINTTTMIVCNSPYHRDYMRKVLSHG